MDPAEGTDSPQKPKLTETLAAGGSQKRFETFLVAEYTNIAQAFFNAGSVITQFFQFYLLALAVPLTAAGVVIKISSGTIDLWWLMHSGIAPYLGVFFLAVGSVGLCMAMYIMNLRLDALLYARTVNGIRRYFYDIAALPKEREALIRILPKDIDQPKHFEPWFFLPVVVAFAVLDSVYVLLGILLFDLAFLWRLSLPTVFVVMHLVVYVALGRDRDRRYRQHPLTATHQDQGASSP